MLILNVYCNDRLIEQICIQNVGHHSGDFWSYKIRKPKGHDGPTFFHRRCEGWMPLAEKVIHYLRKTRPVMEVRITEMSDDGFLALIKNKRKFKKAIAKQVTDALIEYTEADMEVEDDKMLYGDPSAKPPKGIIKLNNKTHYKKISKARGK